MRHGLVDCLHAKTDGKLVDDFQGGFVEVDFPRVVSRRLRDDDFLAVLLVEVVKQDFVETCVLSVVRYKLLLTYGTKSTFFTFFTSFITFGFIGKALGCRTKGIETVNSSVAFRNTSDI